MPKLDFPLFYILRGVQAIFALIVLGLTGHGSYTRELTSLQTYTNIAKL